ncbi:hypothetical protein F0562_008843 [Nyssa sinensis]|uniref:Uncharacterized protein n=1 Tax=Nyssa sinensis TaxID=561372 RepID=A0A5J5AA71_9ASTE|nr:hypothetical protein F0562_008843 [Nyssa sinensis]
MSQYSPQSPFEFTLEEVEIEEVDTDYDQNQPPQEDYEILVVEEEEEEEANNHCLLIPPPDEKSFCEKNLTMKSHAASSSSVPSKERIPLEPPSRSVFALRPRVLSMEDAASPASVSSMKRPFKNSIEGDDSQRKKTKKNEDMVLNDGRDDENPRSDPSKPLFQGFPYEENEDYEDEIAILKGILDYYSKNGIYPFANSSVLHDFINNSLNVNVCPLQLENKILELREKYMKIVEKEGGEPKFLEPCDQEAFHLLKKIWGTESKHVDNLNEFNGEERQKSLGAGQEPDLAMYPFLKDSLQFGNKSVPVVQESIVKVGLGMIGNSKAKELNEKWKMLQVEELEFYLKRVDLIREQTKLMLDGLKSSSVH